MKDLEAARDALVPVLITMKGLYCEHCGAVETSGRWEDRDAAEDLAKRGWTDDGKGELDSTRCPECLVEVE